VGSEGAARHQAREAAVLIDNSFLAPAHCIHGAHLAIPYSALTQLQARARALGTQTRAFADKRPLPVARRDDRFPLQLFHDRVFPFLALPLAKLRAVRCRIEAPLCGLTDEGDLMIIGKFETQANAGSQANLTPCWLAASAHVRAEQQGRGYTVQTETGCEVGAAWKKTSKEAASPHFRSARSPFLPSRLRRVVPAKETGRHVLVWGSAGAQSGITAVQPRGAQCGPALFSINKSFSYDDLNTAHFRSDAEFASHDFELRQQMRRCLAIKFNATIRRTFG